MKVELTPLEARVIGCLIEKGITTPDQYPLSLNALTNACNQKSNRDPVMRLDEAAVQQILDGLKKKYLVSEKSGFGSRVAKYQHRFFNSELGHFRFDDQEMAIVCELLLRGPQTPGELRSRAQRMAGFADVGEVEAALERLMNYPQGPFVLRLPREPGKREARYRELLTGGAESPVAPQPEPSAPAVDRDDRLAQLEARVEALAREVETLRLRVDGFSAPRDDADA